MVKKKSNTRKASGAAGIAVIEDEIDDAADDVGHEANGSQSASEISPAKPGRKAKKVEQQLNGQVGVSEIKKAVAFVNSVGGLDKAIAVLQILKVAKEVQ